MLNQFYQQIQVIMTFLGYYDGVCDGVWGPKCIAAKRQWEYEDSFEPAVPSNGDPFTGRDRLPKGLMYARGNGLKIVCLRMTSEDSEKILKEKGELVTTDHIEKHFSNPEAEVQSVKPVAAVAVQPAPSVSSHVEPAIDLPTPAPEPAPESLEEEEEELIDEPRVEQKQSQPQQKNNWTQNRKK